tara:strand:- start:783 stop:2684 length:1902 start_codon:yes stop_codon:yes gene_type:complete
MTPLFFVDTIQAQSWTRPSELRSKKLIDAAIYTLDSAPVPLNSRTLAEHSQFTLTHPFDGIAVRAELDAKWCEQLRSRFKDQPDVNIEANLDTFLWSKQSVPFAAAESAVANLNRVQWGSLTDNFLWCNFRGGEDVLRADITNDKDWAAVEHNARVVGRVCKEAKFKGLLLDTEQYGHYANSEDPFPLGRGTAEQRRERGRRWIKAIQSECPDVRIIIFFAWSPDLEKAGFLKGVRDFLDGMLEGIEEPGRLVHGYENTFYYGQIAGSRFTNEGFRGDRALYEESRDTIRTWRSLSCDPEKYDRFVQVGMAAWLESDPWNLWNGWPSGTKATIWSNVPMALMASDEYVWCWSEHTNFLHQRTGDAANLPSEKWLNPYLASLTNQTFNRGDEQVRSVQEDFSADPLLRGWYFDFDMLEVGRKLDPSMDVPILTRDAVPYVWLRQDKAVHVRGTWLTGMNGDSVARHGTQRRRFVHPVHPVSNNSRFEFAIDFRIESFGTDNANPIVLGLFHSDQPTDRQSLTLQIRDAHSITFVFAGNKDHWNSEKDNGLKTGRTYRASFDYDEAMGRLRATVRDLIDNSIVCQSEGDVVKVGGFQLNEVGAALWDGEETATPLDKAYRYHLERISFENRQIGI